MKDRLIQLLDLEQLTPSRFADTIGVQRSSVSHVLSGRNKPSFDFLQKTLKAFPGLSAEWLMLGRGKIYGHTEPAGAPGLFDSQAEKPVMQQETEETPEDKGQQLFEGRFEDQGAGKVDEEEETQMEKPSPEAGKRVMKVIIFYEDDTFRSFEPTQ